MPDLKVTANREGMTLCLDGKLLALKKGRAPWVNTSGERVDIRRFPATVRGYIALARTEYRQATTRNGVT